MCPLLFSQQSLTLGLRAGLVVLEVRSMSAVRLRLLDGVQTCESVESKGHRGWNSMVAVNGCAAWIEDLDREFLL